MGCVGDPVVRGELCELRLFFEYKIRWVRVGDWRLAIGDWRLGGRVSGCPRLMLFNA